MHVVQVSYSYETGCPDACELLARYQTMTAWGEALLGAGVAGVTTVQRFSLDCSLRAGGVDYRFVRDAGPPHPRILTATSRTNRAVASLRPDLAHVHGLIYPCQIRQLRRMLPAGTALVVQDHGGADPTRFSPFRRLLSRSLRRADGLFFSTLPQAGDWVSSGILRQGERVFEVMEASTTLRRVPVAHRVLKGSPSILWVGRLVPGKDPLTVLDGFRRALPDLPGACLSFVFNEEALLAQIREMVASSGLANHVDLVGRVEPSRIAEYYSSADIFVLGSLREGSGYALIESLACGVVPVVTDIAPFRELTDRGRLGALYRPGDPEDFRRALVRAARQDLESLRDEIRVHFESRFSWPALVRRALENYQLILASSRQKQGETA